MLLMSEQIGLLGQWAEGPHGEVSACLEGSQVSVPHTSPFAWLQLADIIIENLSVSWWREGPAASPHSPAFTEARVSSLE